MFGKYFWIFWRKHLPISFLWSEYSILLLNLNIKSNFGKNIASSAVSDVVNKKELQFSFLIHTSRRFTMCNKLNKTLKRVEWKNTNAAYPRLNIVLIGTRKKTFPNSVIMFATLHLFCWNSNILFQDQLRHQLYFYMHFSLE